MYIYLYEAGRVAYKAPAYLLGFFGSQKYFDESEVWFYFVCQAYEYLSLWHHFTKLFGELICLFRKCDGEMVEYHPRENVQSRVNLPKGMHCTIPVSCVLCHSIPEQITVCF